MPVRNIQYGAVLRLVCRRAGERAGLAVDGGVGGGGSCGMAGMFMSAPLSSRWRPLQLRSGGCRGSGGGCSCGCCCGCGGCGGCCGCCCGCGCSCCGSGGGGSHAAGNCGCGDSSVTGAGSASASGGSASSRCFTPSSCCCGGSSTAAATPPPCRALHTARRSDWRSTQTRAGHSGCFGGGGGGGAGCGGCAR